MSKVKYRVREYNPTAAHTADPSVPVRTRADESDLTTPCWRKNILSRHGLTTAQMNGS
jgi:hypothetical protein